jgi:anti-sigma factor RsiW
MNCSQTKNLFNDYVLEELDPNIEIQVNEHVAKCENCRSELTDLETFVHDMHAPSRFRPDNAVYQRIKACLHLEPKKRRPFWIFPRNLVYAAATFLLGMALMRTADAVLFPVNAYKRSETQSEPIRKTPFADTVEFYTVPVENLAKT